MASVMLRPRAEHQVLKLIAGQQSVANAFGRCYAWAHSPRRVTAYTLASTIQMSVVAMQPTQYAGSARQRAHCSQPVAGFQSLSLISISTIRDPEPPMFSAEWVEAGSQKALPAGIDLTCTLPSAVVSLTLAGVRVTVT